MEATLVVFAFIYIPGFSPSSEYKLGCHWNLLLSDFNPLLAQINSFHALLQHNLFFFLVDIVKM